MSFGPSSPFSPSSDSPPNPNEALFLVVEDTGDAMLADLLDQTALERMLNGLSRDHDKLREVLAWSMNADVGAVKTLCGTFCGDFILTRVLAGSSLASEGE